MKQGKLLAVLRQHNSITEARYNLNALEKNIVYLLISVLGDADPPGKEYIVPIETLEKKLGREISQNSLFSATRNLLTRNYTIKRPNGNLFCFSLITVAEYQKDLGILRLKISDKVHPLFVALKSNYTEFLLDAALSLRSKYSKRIYEMLSMHKSEGGFVIGVDELKRQLLLIDSKTGEEKLKNWTVFETTVLKRAKEEIAKKTDINFSYSLIARGRKYSEIRFRISDNPIQLAINI